MKSIIYSVGGSPAPILVSLKEHQPDRVVFFCSKVTRADVFESILPRLEELGLTGMQHGLVVTQDHQDVGVCMSELLQQVPREMQKLGEAGSWPDVTDYTGGTKSMSAALVWAASRHSGRLSYVGAVNDDSRTKGGKGIVMDGRELCMLKENPWNRLAWWGAYDAINAFNHAQYSMAKSKLESVLASVDDARIQRLLEALTQVFSGFAYWDAFDHAAAHKVFGPNMEPLELLAEKGDVLWPGLESFADSVGELVAQKLRPVLKCSGKSVKIGNSKTPLSQELIEDLLANALRRARVEAKYEDATARCYSAIEKFLKLTAINNFGIDNDGADPQRIPESLRAEFVQKYSGELNETLRFGLHATGLVLETLGDPVGQRFQSMHNNLRSHLDWRNQSVLGHGIMPMTEHKFMALFNDALCLMDLSEEQLVTFPVIRNH